MAIQTENKALIFLGNFLFGFVQLAINFDFDKYIYSGYNIGFDAFWSFLLSDGKGVW